MGAVPIHFLEKKKIDYPVRTRGIDATFGTVKSSMMDMKDCLMLSFL